MNDTCGHSRNLVLATVVGMALALLSLGVSGCASSAGQARTTAPAGDPIGEVPNDFSVDLAILRGWGVEDRPESHLRPLRIVLFPDGSLHSGSDVSRGRVNYVPGLTRRLNRDQLGALYALARQLSFSDHERADPMQNPLLIQPNHNEIVYVLAISGNDRRWQFVRRLAPAAGEEPDPVMQRFVRQLADLAWETDLRAEQPLVMPRRYDFGPDPYARYRE
jgi:hypothetical protein